MAAPMAKLMHAGAALGEGKPVSPIASTLREADELSLVLSNAAKELDVRMGAQAHLAAIVTSSPSAVVSLSPAGIIRTWNAAATSLFGYEEAEVIGRPMAILAPDGARRGDRQAQCQRPRRLRRARGRRAPAQGRPAHRRLRQRRSHVRRRPQAGRHLRDHQRHRRAQGARAAHRVPDARGLAPLQEPARRGAGDRRTDGAAQPQRRGVPGRASPSASPPWPAARTCWSAATGRARPWPTWCARSWRRSRRTRPRASRSRDRAWSSSPTPCTASRWPCTSLPPTPPSTARCPCPTAASPSTGRSSGAETAEEDASA